MKNSIRNNLEVWDLDYEWSQDGDEWTGQALRCGQPYERWKKSLVTEFLIPNLSPSSTVVEIGPGHGRWTRLLEPLCGELILIDLSPSCIDHCRTLLEGREAVEYHVTDGVSLPGVAAESVDFVWSYDSFVHIDREECKSYLREIERVLRPGGRAVLHHAGRRHGFLWLRALRPLGGFFSTAYKLASMGQLGDDDGWRSDVSAVLFGRWARRAGLEVERQVRRWGDRGEFGVPRYRDVVTVLCKR